VILGLEEHVSFLPASEDFAPREQNELNLIWCGMYLSRDSSHLLQVFQIVLGGVAVVEARDMGLEPVKK
jgi:hypothetical protein